MIDTATLWVDGEHMGQVASRLSDVRETLNHHTGSVSLSGNLENLKVKAHPHGFSVFGSLSKYTVGDNLTNTSRADIEQAIGKLSDTLSVRLSTAKVYRVDIGATFHMERPVSEYLRACGPASRYEKKPYRTGLMYTNTRRSLLLYDKLEEMKAKGEAIPEHESDTHVLRYEVQFKKRLKRQFKRVDPVTAELLYDRHFYTALVDYWKREYAHIQKRRPLVLMEPTGWREFRDHLALVGTKALGGIDAVYELLENAKEDGTLERRQYYRLRSHIKQLTEAEGLTRESRAAEELRKKIETMADRAC